MSVLPKNLNYYLSGDFALTHDGGDYSEIGVWGVSEDRKCYAIDWWHGQTTSNVWVDKLIEFIRQYDPLMFFGESGNIEKSVGPFMKDRMVRENALVRLKLFPLTANKEARAMSFQGMAGMGEHAANEDRVVFFPQTAWADRVIDQLMKFPYGRHDDAVDCCANFGQGIRWIWEAETAAEKKDPLEAVNTGMSGQWRDWEPNDKFKQMQIIGDQKYQRLKNV